MQRMQDALEEKYLTVEDLERQLEQCVCGASQLLVALT